MPKVLAIVLSYLLGGILTGEIIGLISKVDLRKKGSGNPGATNVYRLLGPIFGVIVLSGDVLKGIGGTMIGAWLGVPELAPWCALAVIAGHNWPPFFGFQGGKGIATSFGTIIVLVPKILWLAVPVWVLLLLASGYVSLASIGAAVALPVGCLLFYPEEKALLIYGIVACLLAVYRHRHNIQRIRNGTENRILRRKRLREEIR
jgi:glycerol-3-phosphate acyltransferase PlsY